MSFLLVIVILAAVVIWVVMTYNNFIRYKNNADEAWSDIDVQIKRRHDLIPNLIESVKGYASHESGVFTAVTEARTRAMQSGNPEELAKAENALMGTLKSLFAVAENYPELKANANFIELQKELSDTENKIQAARRFYNGTVRDMTSAMQVFPGNFIASIFGFKTRNFFELDDATEKEVPQVKF